MPHLEEGVLHALLDGEIPSSELGSIQAHLASCPECRARLAAERELLTESDRLVELIEVPKGVEAPRPKAARQARVWPRNLAWAATVLLAAGLGYAARGATVIARERSDRGDRVISNPVAPAPSAPRTDSMPPPPVIARDRSDRRDRAAGKPIAAAAPVPRNDSTAPRKDTTVVASERSNQIAAALSAPRHETPVIARERSDRGDLAAAAPVARTAALPPAEPIELPEALRRLGGSIRLIDGMVPLRLEARGGEIRIVYPSAQGELVLSQQLLDGRIVFRLLPPPGMPLDSLERLRARVRE